jgi:hypothetical protein
MKCLILIVAYVIWEHAGNLFPTRYELGITASRQQTSSAASCRMANGWNQNGYGCKSGYDAHAGQEFDLLADWRPVVWSHVCTGYGRFFIGDYIRRSISFVPANSGVVDANWAYMQVSIDF